MVEDIKKFHSSTIWSYKDNGSMKSRSNLPTNHHSDEITTSPVMPDAFMCDDNSYARPTSTRHVRITPRRRSGDISRKLTKSNHGWPSLARFDQGRPGCPNCSVPTKSPLSQEPSKHGPGGVPQSSENFDQVWPRFDQSWPRFDRAFSDPTEAYHACKPSKRGPGYIS